MTKHDIAVCQILNVIHFVTGITIEDIKSKSRDTRTVDGRILFIHHCREIGMTVKEIADRIDRNHSSVTYLEQKYYEYHLFSSVFRTVANNVAAKLKSSLSNESK